MLFDIAWPELMLIAAVALVVIGPKDLPRALRIAGMWVRKARNMSRDFQNSIEQMIRDTELDEMRREIREATEFDFEHEISKTIDADGSLAESLAPPATPDYFEPSLPTLEAPAVAPPLTAEVAAPEAIEAAAVNEADEPELPLSLPEMPPPAHYPESPKP